jgi:GT2 family glycosyltransferase
MTDITSWDRITVILVTRNSESILPTSLGSLPQDVRIILIDAMSTDRTIEVAKECHPGIEIISLAEDRGLGAACNLGFQRAETEYVLNINPDTQLPNGCVERLVAAADASPNAAGVAPVLTNANGDMDLTVMGPWERHHYPIPAPPDGPFCTWFLTGAVVLWRLVAFRDIGGFDENFFLYNEDADLGMRAIQKGYSLIVEPAALGQHFGGRSEDISLKSRIRRDKNMMWGHLMYERKYASAEEADLIAQRELRKCCGNVLAGLLTARPKKILTNIAKARAAYSFLHGGPPWGR